MAVPDRLPPQPNPFTEPLKRALHGNSYDLAKIARVPIGEIYERDSISGGVARVYEFLNEEQKPAFCEAIADLITDLDIPREGAYTRDALLWLAFYIAPEECLEPAVNLINQKLKPRIDEKDIAQTAAIVVHIAVKLVDQNRNSQAIKVLKTWMDEPEMVPEKALILQGLVIYNPDHFPTHLPKFFQAADIHRFSETHVVAEMAKRVGPQCIARLSHELGREDLMRFFNLLNRYPYSEKFQTIVLNVGNSALFNPQTGESFPFVIPLGDQEKFDFAFGTLS